MRKFWTFFLFLSIISQTTFLPLQASETKSPIVWQDWTDDLFQKAQTENKFVILDLEAVWCHWCHVMEETTYVDPKVVELLQAKYIPVRVDQDAHPDLSLRYENWGWPATIIFAPDGTELVKRRGYIPPQGMSSLLQAVIDDPTPGPSVLEDEEIILPDRAYLSEEQKKNLEEAHVSTYDKKFASWGQGHKLIDAANLEYAMIQAQKSDTESEKRARLTLDNALNLLDPEWGGFYQYSDQADWKSPHYEKIMSIQSQYMRLYALAYALWKEPRYLNAAEKTADYVAKFWTSQDGGFYTSQDADVNTELRGKDFYSLKSSERLQLEKAPKIDRSIYSKENGWMIASLCVLYDVTGSQSYLNAAKRTADWILVNRGSADGGFRHDHVDRAGPYLGDTLSMGQAFLNLYASTANRKWLGNAQDAAVFITKNFKDEKSGGFITAPVEKNATGVFQKPVKQADENIALSRFMNSLFHYTGIEDYKNQAKHAMQYLAAPNIRAIGNFLTGILLADRELAQDPAHLTVVGLKEDAAAITLYKAALEYPLFYRRIEWLDIKEGPLPNPDVQYPTLPKSAIFVCANGQCSLPIFAAEKIAKTIERSRGKN